MDRPTEKLQAHGLEWLSVESFGPTVRRLDLERARHPGGLSEEEFVKDNTVRTVLRLPDPQRPGGPGLYVKRYKFRDLSDRIRYLFVRTKARVEWEMSRALQEAGIPTCDVLAIGSRRRWALYREGFLVSREIEGALQLRDFLTGSDPGQRDEVLEELGTLTAQLANKRFYHRDYHLGNLLIRPAAPTGERLFVVDLHAVRRRRPRGRRLRRMLGMLLNSFPPSLGRPARRGVLRAFLSRWSASRGAVEAALRIWERRLERTRRSLRRRHMRSRTRRCMVESSLFTADRGGGFRVRRRRDFPLESALQAVERHRKALLQGEQGARARKEGRRTEVSVVPSPTVPPFGVGQPVPPDQVEPGRVCVKGFRRDTCRERLKDTFRPRSRARANWIAARGFSVRGVPAARPLALLESHPKLAGRPDYFVMEALEADGTLRELAGNLGKAERSELARATARLLNQMAEEQVYHPDTKPSNLLVKLRDGGPRLWLVDLDRARFDSPMTEGRWVKVLARLNAGLGAGVTLVDRLRCLRQLSRGRWDGPKRKELARRVYELSLTRRPAWRQ